MAVAGCILARHCPGPSRIRPLLPGAVGQHGLESLPTVRSSELQRHAQLCRLGTPDSGAMVWLQEIPMDFWRVGSPYPVRYPSARTLVLSDALPVAFSDASGEWPAVGSTSGDDSELHRADHCLHADDWHALPSQESGVTAQNCWGERRHTVDSLRFSRGV